MEEVPGGAVGEVWVRGATLMREYWNKPEATREAITPEGWFRTGDLGRLDSEGYLYIVDRLKDLIIRGGENISSSEVEAAVYEHGELVVEVAALGLPHPTLGEEVAVAVLFKTRQQDASNGEELLRRLKADKKLAAFKMPTRIIDWGESLPRGATGKIQKREIKAIVARNEAKSRL
jgi:long-chain acyl-CoA synthetase